MTKDEGLKLKPFDIVIYTDFKGQNYDVLVKSVTENGVFCLERIQSTAVLFKFEDLNKIGEIWVKN
jgi:hypothetical protein